MRNTDISLKRLPPHNVSAEMSVLGAILFDNDALMKISGIITAQDFYEPKHLRIFKVMWGMSQLGMNIDLVTLADRLLQTGDLEMIGGPPYLMDLMEETPTATAIIAHAEIVKEKSNLRKLIAISTQINLEAYGERVEVDKLLDNAEKLFFDVKESVVTEKKDWEKLGETLPEIYQDIQAINEPSENRKSSFIPTGFRCVDDIIIGLFESDMVVVAGRPSMGKTAFAFSVARNIAMNGDPVAIFSLETKRKPAAMRFLCTEAMVDSHEVKTGNLGDSDWQKLTEGVASLSNIPLYICDSPRLSLVDLRFKARMVVKKYGVKLIIIDYLQLMKISGMKGNRTQEVSEISGGISAIGKELGVCMMPLSQLSREVEKRKPPRPVLSDLKESGSIEQDSDMVMMLYRHSYYEKKVIEFGGEDLTTEIIINKNRNGKIGTAKTIFQKKWTRFEERSEYD